MTFPAFKAGDPALCGSDGGFDSHTLPPDLSVRESSMARNIRNRQKIDVGKEARRRARMQIGRPPAEKIVPDKRKKPPRHKKRLMEDDWM